jgi:4-cresol dehydrogenase (hydroxylating) flavoprotein subunit
MRTEDLEGRTRLATEALVATADTTGFVALARAIAGWRRALGEEAVIIDDGRKRYAQNCIGLARSIPAVLRPKDEAAVQAAMAVARDCGVPLHPISTGRNWGYGGAIPASSHAAVMDLSAMRAIAWRDRELGLIRLQPGVTHGQLSEFLAAEGAPFLVPVTGAGPTGSLVGNALERGYGITPHADHFAAVRTIRAVLADGSIYRSAMAESGADLVDAAYKWGTGPYLDGLYSQGGFGIVTEMTLALAPRPERIEAFAIEIEDDDRLEAAVTGIRDIMQMAGGCVGGINLINRLRLLAMTQPCPLDQAIPGLALSPDLVDRMGKAAGLPRWLLVGALYGDRQMVAGLRRDMKRRLAPVGARLRFMDQSKADTVSRVANLVPGRLGARLRRRAANAVEALDLLSGQPRETALRLAYWRSGIEPPAGTARDPARDGCGLIWFSPLVPMKPDAVATLVELVESTCRRHGIDPLITFSSVSAQCFDCTIPLLYDPSIGAETAHQCYDALADACREHGLLPYRMNPRAMRKVVDDPDSQYWRLVSKLKSAVDPDDLVSPGRYAPLPPNRV